MARHSRKLLILAALCWVAPVSAQQRPAVSAHATAHPKGCPYAQATALAAVGPAKPATVIVVSSNGTMGGDPMLGAARRAFQP